MMRLLADENIPLVNALFPEFEVRTMAGRSIVSAALKPIDVLLVRSVTRVDRRLLEGSAVKVVGSATAGVDHVATGDLVELGVDFAHAPGSNARSVAEYVLAALYATDTAIDGRRVAVVGLGQIGGLVSRMLRALGATVLPVDPLREALEPSAEPWVDLHSALEAADIVTVHVPLHDGPHGTKHLIDRAELERMRRGVVFINTSRGATVNNCALLSAAESGRFAALVMDVWEHEPRPMAALIELADIATPHIAGYSRDGKVAGTWMLRRHVEQVLGLAELTRPEPERHLTLRGPRPGEVHTWLAQHLPAFYDVMRDDQEMRRVYGADGGAGFVRLRKQYPARREFSAVAVHGDFPPSLEALGFARQ